MNKALVCIALCSLLFPVQVTAAEGAREACGLDQVVLQLEKTSDSVSTDRAYEVDDSLLFYQFFQELSLGGDLIGVEISRDGEILVQESIELIASLLPNPGAEAALAASGTTVIEVLGTSPAMRARLAEGRDGLTVTVRLNGDLFETLSFEELQKRSLVLREAETLPHALRSDLSPSRKSVLASKNPGFTVGAGFLTKDACTDYCSDEHDNCPYDRCGQFPSQGCLDACDAQFEDCLESCGVCQTSSSTSQAISLVSVTPQGITQCMNDTFFWGKGIFEWTKRRFKVVTTTTTTNADCSITTSTSTSFFNNFCWSFRYNLNCFPFPGNNFCF